MSPAIGTTVRPVSAAICFAVAASGSAVRAVITTSAPSCASCSATARPIPLLAPVTKATFPASCRSTPTPLARPGSDGIPNITTPEGFPVRPALLRQRSATPRRSVARKPPAAAWLPIDLRHDHVRFAEIYATQARGMCLPGVQHLTRATGGWMARGQGVGALAGGEGAAEDLADVVAGQGGQPEHLLGALVGGQRRPGVPDQGAFVEVMAGAHDHPRRHLLAPALVGDAGHGGLRDRRVIL